MKLTENGGKPLPECRISEQDEVHYFSGWPPEEVLRWAISAWKYLHAELNKNPTMYAVQRNGDDMANFELFTDEDSLRILKRPGNV